MAIAVEIYSVKMQAAPQWSIFPCKSRFGNVKVSTALPRYLQFACCVSRCNEVWFSKQAFNFCLTHAILHLLMRPSHRHRGIVNMPNP